MLKSGVFVSQLIKPLKPVSPLVSQNADNSNSSFKNTFFHDVKFFKFVTQNELGCIDFIPDKVSQTPTHHNLS